MLGSIPRTTECRGGWPSDLPNSSFPDRNDGPVHLEVVVVLRVDVGKTLTGKLTQHMVDEARCRFGGIVPALKGGNQNRLGQWW
jgi:hypothetical protein